MIEMFWYPTKLLTSLNNQKNKNFRRPFPMCWISIDTWQTRQEKTNFRLNFRQKIRQLFPWGSKHWLSNIHLKAFLSTTLARVGSVFFTSFSLGHVLYWNNFRTMRSPVRFSLKKLVFKSSLNQSTYQKVLLIAFRIHKKNQIDSEKD